MTNDVTQVDTLSSPGVCCAWCGSEQMSMMTVVGRGDSAVKFGACNGCYDDAASRLADLGSGMSDSDDNPTWSDDAAERCKERRMCVDAAAGEAIEGVLRDCLPYDASMFYADHDRLIAKIQRETTTAVAAALADWDLI